MKEKRIDEKKIPKDLIEHLKGGHKIKKSKDVDYKLQKRLIKYLEDVEGCTPFKRSDYE